MMGVYKYSEILENDVPVTIKRPLNPSGIIGVPTMIVLIKNNASELINSSNISTPF